MDTNKMITIGKITKNQGNKGEVRVLPLTDFPERYELLEKVYLIKDDMILEKKIESLRFHKNFIIIKFNDINNIGSAVELRDYQIKITEDMLLPLDEDNYYIDDILGFEVYIKGGQLIGNIIEVLSTGGTDVFIVGGYDREYMIPAAHEIVIEINTVKKRMVVDPIPGLLDL